ncbi:THUMP domain-containing protein [Candidatus Kapaibacterium sp.]
MYSINYNKVIVKTFQGLEDVLASEIEKIGGRDIEVLNRAVLFSGNKESVYAANVKLRTALRVLIPISDFDVFNENDLYKHTKSFPWQDLITPSSTIAVDSFISNSPFNHTNYVALKVKDAIVDKMREHYNSRPSVDVENPVLRVNVHIFKNNCTLSLDTSGYSLHKRGYRQAQTDAPLNECLAAGMILMSGWENGIDFYDLMCGSGTFTTEAFSIASNTAPNIHGNFSFLKWKDYEPDLFKKVIDDAKKSIVDVKSRFFTSDISAKAVAVTKTNMRNPDMRKKVHISQKDFFETLPQAKSGMIMLNPPYGERISLDDNKDFYKRIGDKLKFDYPDFNCWILSGNPESVKFIGLKPSKKINLLNGKIECKFNRYDLYTGSRKENMRFDKFQ